MKLGTPVLTLFVTLLVARGGYAQNQYYLPHVADGYFGAVSFRTTFILFNNSDADVQVALKLTDNGGKPLIVAIEGFEPGSQFDLTLRTGETRFLQTDGSGEGAVGAATVTAKTPVGVSAIFTVYDTYGNYMTEAGVGSSVPLTEFVLPVDSTGFFLTGLALFNPGGSTASITMTLLNTDGSQVDKTTQSLVAGGHSAVFLAAAGQLFPTVRNFRGTLLVQSTSAVAALVLRQYQDAALLSYTSLPAVPRASSRLSLNLAHVANGSYGSISFKTSFLIFNISSSPADVTLALTRDDGTPFTVTIPAGGAGTRSGSSFQFTLAVGASIFLETDGSGTGTSGAATITSNVPVGASAVFSVLSPQGQFQTEAGVGDSPVLTSFTLPVDITGSFDTGVAFYNPGGNSITLTLRLFDDSGELVDSSTQMLSPKSHLATFVDNLFPETSDFIGSLAVSASGGVAATTLRQYASGATYTTLPTASGTSAGRAVALFLSKTVTGIDVTSSTPEANVNATLTRGIVLSGAVRGAGQAFEVIASAGGKSVFAGAVDPLTGRYRIAAPAGTYSLTVWYRPAGMPSDAALTVSYSDPVSVQVSKDTLRNISLPSVPLFRVSGTVSGLSSLPSGETTTIVFTSDDHKTQAMFIMDAGGNYEGILPEGNYLASISRAPVTFSQVQIESLSLYNLGPLTVGGGPGIGNYSVPATAKLSGTIHSQGVVSVPSGITILSTDTSANASTQSSCCPPPAESDAIADTAGQYQMVLAKNRSYAVGVSLQLQGTNLFSVIRYPLSAPEISLGGDTTHDITIPNLPRSDNFLRIFGRVTDEAGHALSGVTVTVTTESIPGAANVGFTAGGMTDDDGNYSIVVYSGSDYQVTFVPPVPVSDEEGEY